MNVLKTALTILVITFTISCSKDDDNDTPTDTPTDSRNVKYEITGNATGTFDATYITGSGSGTNEKPASLPWSKEIVLQNSLTTVTLNSAVLQATPGKTITAKIYVGGVVKKEQTATVQSDGTGIIAGLTYVLK